MGCKSHTPLAKISAQNGDLAQTLPPGLDLDSAVSTDQNQENSPRTEENSETEKKEPEISSPPSRLNPSLSPSLGKEDTSLNARDVAKGAGLKLKANVFALEGSYPAIFKDTGALVYVKRSLGRNTGVEFFSFSPSCASCPPEALINSTNLCSEVCSINKAASPLMVQKVLDSPIWPPKFETVPGGREFYVITEFSKPMKLSTSGNVIEKNISHSSYIASLFSIQSPHNFSLTPDQLPQLKVKEPTSLPTLQADLKIQGDQLTIQRTKGSPWISVTLNEEKMKTPKGKKVYFLNVQDPDQEILVGLVEDPQQPNHPFTLFVAVPKN